MFEYLTNVLLSMFMFSYCIDGSSQIFAFIVCSNLTFSCILMIFASHGCGTILCSQYKTETVLFSLIYHRFLMRFLTEKSIDLVNSTVDNKE